MKDPLVRAVARAKASFRETDPDVMAYEEGVNERNKRTFTEEKVKKAYVKKEEQEQRRKDALELFERQQDVCPECMDVNCTN